MIQAWFARELTESARKESLDNLKEYLEDVETNIKTKAAKGDLDTYYYSEYSKIAGNFPKEAVKKN